MSTLHKTMIFASKGPALTLQPLKVFVAGLVKLKLVLLAKQATVEQLVLIEVVVCIWQLVLRRLGPSAGGRQPKAGPMRRRLPM